MYAQHCPNKSVHKGYTLVELLVVITIISILVAFGLTAFGKARERQAIQQAKEKILATLQNAQKAAFVGDKDCTGSLLGIEVRVTASGVTSQARCVGNDGAITTTVIPDVVITSSPIINFRPLEQGVSFASGSVADIDYTILGNSYRIQITPPGTITYMGQQ